MNEPQAFPTDEYYDEKRYAQTPGMTLRDYFAAQALIGLLSHRGPRKGTALSAYKAADAMLEARK